MAQRRILIVSALCAASAGCREDTSYFSAQVVTRAPEVADWSALTIDVAGPDLRHTFRRSDFNPEAGSSTQFLTRTVKLRGTGTLVADVVLPGAAGTPPAEVRVSFPVEPDWRYAISVFIGGPRPGPFLCGQLRGAAVLPSLPAESLYVATGGSPQDAVC